MKGREKMRFIVCGDALFSSRNLAKRLDKTLVERLQNADASKRSDLTIFSLHTHEGVNENWYSSQPPDVYECREFILWDEWLAGDLCISSKACLQCTYLSMPLP